jgi:hypothetical protein
MDRRGGFFLLWTCTVSFFVVLRSPAVSQADGSIFFNGANSAPLATSRIQNTTNNVLNSASTMTITVWVKAAGIGEGGGHVFWLADKVILAHENSANNYSFNVIFGGANAEWTFSASDTAWHCLQVTYDKSLTTNDPSIYVDGVLQNEAEPTPPSGGLPSIGNGYYVGNNSGQTATFNGQIAQVQVHNRILSLQELDNCRVLPGSVTSDLRLWLRMATASDINDQSGNNFHGTGTDLATGLDGPPIANQAVVPPGTIFFPAGVTAVTQHIIPRYVVGTSYPAGQVRGWGPVSEIRGTAETQNLPAGKQGIVITEEYDQAIAQWQSDTAAKKAVLQAAVRNVTIAGYDDTGNNYASGSGLVHNDPAEENRITGAITDVSDDGIDPISITSSNHGLSTNDVVTIQGVLGNTNANGVHQIMVSNENVFTLNDTEGEGNYSGGGVWTTQSRWQDKYHGLLMRSSGLLVENVNFFYIPGRALEIKKGGTGQHTGPKLTFDSEKAQIWDCKVNRAYQGFLISDIDAIVGRLEGTDLRDYGIKVVAGAGSMQIDGALRFERVGVGGVDQPGVWFDNGAGPCWGGPIYTKSCQVGMFLYSSENKLSHYYSEDCPKGNLVIWGSNNLIAGGEISVADGTTELNGAPGVFITGQYTTLRDMTIRLPEDKGGADVGETAIHIPAGSNGGYHLTLDNIMIIGNDTNGKGVGVETKSTLNNTTIIAYVKYLGGGVGIDLLDGTTDRVGNGNTIWITYDTASGDMTAQEALQLHSNWDPANSPAGDTNDVRINGVRYYKQ